MLAKIIVWYFIVKVITAQFNGDFWWLNEKLTKGSERTPPKYENLSEFDTDESAKIIFRDNKQSLYDDKTGINKEDEGRTINNNGKEKLIIQFQDKSKIVWPSEDVYVSNQIYHRPKNEYVLKGNKYQKLTQSNDDIMNFKFPEDDNLIWKDEGRSAKNFTMKKPGNNRNYNNQYNNTSFHDKIPLKLEMEELTDAENICTFLKKTECNHRSGVIYTKQQRGSRKLSVDSQLICCVIPKSTDESSKITFFDNALKKNSRYKRSLDENISSALKQRYALLMRKYASQIHKSKPTSTVQTKETQKIVTPDEDYVDPYLNIKNSNFRNPITLFNRKPSTTKHEYGSDDYVEDYIVELPRPGLVGLYSDHAGNSPTWSFGNENTRPSYGSEIESDDEGVPSFGYGASIDPRLEDRIVPSKPIKDRRPAKLTTAIATSEELTRNSESQTINYQANPDFQVLQGFKLLNLVQNKNKIHKNGKKRSTTERVIEDDSVESILIGPDTESDDVFDTNEQGYNDCGKAVMIQDYGRYKNNGEAENGSHPWLTMVVLTKNQHKILCYATLVNAKAAVTAADCVHGRKCPGDITLIAGAWDLNDERHEGWQKRMASVHLHEQYIPGDLANNLAILHWKRPLRLNINIQPACLTDPHVGDDCKFYGWGGYDQAIRPHSRWQSASILTPRVCNERLSSKLETLPKEVFCASVHSRGTVTGVGAPLMCSIGGRHAAAGVAIWRDNVVLLAPAHEWTTRTLTDLNLK